MNGLHTDISDTQWGKMTQHQKLDIIYGVLCRIDKQGCLWAQKKDRIQTKKLYAIGALSGGIGGIIVALGKELGIDLSKWI